MIEHCVLIRFKPETAEAKKQELYDGLWALRHDIPGFTDGRFGPNMSIENLDQGYLDGFILTFADESARQTYLDNEKHKALGERIVGVSDAIVVFDLQS